MSEIVTGGQTKIVIKWVYITKIVVYGILFWNYKKKTNSLQENFQKIFLYFLSNFLYAYIFGSCKLSLQL
jgi:hypothetical protein